MSWNRVGKPADVVKIGDEIDVKILKLNPNTRKVSLGVKQLTPDPWTVAAEKFQSGQKATGIVARLTEFGAFVECLPGQEGLVHVSELADHRVQGLRASIHRDHDGDRRRGDAHPATVPLRAHA